MVPGRLKHLHTGAGLALGSGVLQTAQETRELQRLFGTDVEHIQSQAYRVSELPQATALFKNLSQPQMT